MDFELSEEQLSYKDQIIRFARKELNDDLIERDEKGIFLRDKWHKCGDLGILGLPFPSEYGGSDADALTTMIALEALGYGCRDSGFIFSICAQMLSVQMPLWEFGNDNQKEKYLRKLSAGELIGAHAMSEPESGSDVFSLNTTAVRKEDKYILNGTKTFVTNAPIADLFVIFATVNKAYNFMGITAFVVDRNADGLTLGSSIKKMGLRTSPMSEVFLDDCTVPEENLLGKEGMGAVIFKSSMEWERSFILACNVGAMERQLEDCLKYAKDRRQFNRSIGKFQSVANKLVDMKVRLDTARLLLYRVGWLRKINQSNEMQAAIAKLYISEAWVQSCLDAIQIHGGYGYTTEYEVERDLRDSIGGRIYSGTSEIQKNIIAKNLGL